MFKLILFLTLAVAAVQSAKVYEQCGGKDWKGDKTCESGCTCKSQNEYYSQCVPGNQPAPATTKPASGTTAKPAGTTAKPSGATSAAPANLKSQWPFGKFSHGRGFDNGGDQDCRSSDWDTCSIWIAWNNFWDPNAHGKWCEVVKANKKQAIVYGYVIAFSARKDTGMHDCDMSDYNLCSHGSKYITENRAKIIGLYADYAAKIAACLGADSAPIFLIEPDFWQYYGDHKQKPAPLSGEFMRKLHDDICAAIRKVLPKSRFSFDISAWIGKDGMSKWWGYFKSSPYIEFANTSGGQGTSEANIKPNELKYSDIKEIVGKPIIADCGYGVGGGASSNCHQWSPEKIAERIRDGVIHLTQANPGYRPGSRHRPTF